MEEEIYLPYILHNLGSPLSCSNSLFGSFRWFLRVVQIIPYRGKELFERIIKTILTNDKCHLFPNNGRLLRNNGRLLESNGRDMEVKNLSSILKLKTNKGVLRDLWKMEEKILKSYISPPNVPLCHKIAAVLILFSRVSLI